MTRVSLDTIVLITFMSTDQRNCLHNSVPRQGHTVLLHNERICAKSSASKCTVDDTAEHVLFEFCHNSPHAQFHSPDRHAFTCVLLSSCNNTSLKEVTWTSTRNPSERLAIWELPSLQKDRI